MVPGNNESHAVVITGAGCMLANHARMSGASWISKAWRWARRQGETEPAGRDELRTAAYRAAQRRKTESAQVPVLLPELSKERDMGKSAK